MDFLEKLDMLMRQRGLNRKQLSIESGIPYSTIMGLYSKGHDSVRLPTLIKLSQFFKCSIDSLVDNNVIEEENELVRKYNKTDSKSRRIVDFILDDK